MGHESNGQNKSADVLVKGGEFDKNVYVKQVEKIDNGKDVEQKKHEKEEIKPTYSIHQYRPSPQ